MKSERRFCIIKDNRAGILYLDYTETLIRDFEEVIKESDSFQTLRKEFPFAKDLTAEVVSQ